MTRTDGVSRRRVLGGMAGLGAAATLGMPYVALAASGSVTFFSYTTYTDPKLTGAFPEQTGIDLQIQNYGNLDQMVAKIKATGGGGIDVVSVANNLTNQLFEDGLLEPLDVLRLENWQHIYPEFQNADFVQTGMDGKVIGLPTVWGPEGLIYRTDKVDHADSWTALWDERYEGRISAVDYAYEMVLIAAQVLGYDENLQKDPITFTDAQYDAIKAKLIDQKRLVTKYWGSSAEGATLVAGGEVWVSVGRLSMLGPAEEENVPVKLIAPKEGAQGWCTSTCIVSASENKDAAYEFLDYITGPTYQDALARVRGYPLANKAIMQELPAALRNKLMLNDPDLLKSMVWWKRADDIQRINNLWNEVKAA